MVYIDDTKLKRNYRLNPLILSRIKGKTETPYYEDLLYLYIELNLSIKELIEYFNCSPAFVGRCLKKYNIKKPKELKNEIRKKTNLRLYGTTDGAHSELACIKRQETIKKRYGCENVFQSEYIKNKSKQTKLKRYGDETYVNIKKAKETNLKKYGCENVFQSEYIKNKSKQTCLEKYGVDNYSKTKEYRNKFNLTNKKRFGVENFNQKNINENYLNILKDEKLLKKFIIDNNICSGVELSKIFNITDSTASKYIRKYNLSNILIKRTSIEEKEVRKYINQYYKTENNVKLLGRQEIDIYIPEKKFGIEFNGNFWHSEYHKEKKYHQEKSLLAENNGIFLYHIFEYEWDTKKDQILNQLTNLLGMNKTKIYARKCIIKEVDNNEKSEFLAQHHLQGDDVSSIKLGLYYNNELVSIMTFVKPRFNKNYQWELSRFCSKSNCNVVGGASKLWKYFNNTYKPTSVISYSNIAHTKGNLYKTLGMTLQGISSPNYVWTDGHNTLSRYKCQKHKLLEQGYTGSSEVDIMTKRGYYKIYDCGNKVWIFRNS
jgi:hypothetical protein